MGERIEQYTVVYVRKNYLYELRELLKLNDCEFFASIFCKLTGFKLFTWPGVAYCTFSSL